MSKVQEVKIVVRLSNHIESVYYRSGKGADIVSAIANIMNAPYNFVHLEDKKAVDEALMYSGFIARKVKTIKNR